MSNVSSFNTTASGNNASPPNGFPEGQAASTVNNAARELMAALARWYGDTQGSLATGGTGNSYTLTSNSSHAALADQSILVFRADRANTGSATLAVDGLAAKTIKVFDADLESGDIAADQIIAVVYNSTNDTYDLLSPPALSSSIRNAINNEDTTLPSILSDTKASRPAAGTEGRWFYAEDESRWYRDDGSNWLTKGGHLERVLVWGDTANSQSIPDTTATDMTFQVEQYDTDDMWSSGGVITCPRDGVVICNAGVVWEVNSSGFRQLGIEQEGLALSRLAVNKVDASASSDIKQSVTTAPIEVSAGDEIAAEVFHNAGASLDIDDRYLSVHYIE